ncbi:MAG: hypothetical protein DLM58_01610 [Pseudonocardiales bacterium]|nr:MAG: hypothetical protein DLM58_01610 [Pseudonocardiales bacterium]
MVKALVGGRPFDFSKDEIERRMRQEEPESIREHLVEVNGRSFPPKQVLATVTGWNRTTFTTMEAQRVLTRAGFTCRRNGNMALGGPAVMVPVRAGDLGRLDEIAVQAGRVGVAIDAAENASRAARQELRALLESVRDLMNDQEDQ